MHRRDFVRSGGAAAAWTAAAAFAETAKGAVRITGLETDLLRFPPGKPFFDAIHTFGTESGGVVLRLRTDAGITGWAYSSFGMIAGGPRVVQTILEQEVKPVLMGQDPAFSKRLRADLWKALEYQGVQGVAQFAIAAADIAIWDILGKAAGLPVYKMLGAYADRIPAYSMCGWYYENDGDLTQFKRAITSAFEEGFPAVKIKVGRASLDDDIHRIEAARAIGGKDRRVMVDANQAFHLNEAIRRGRVYQQMGCYWYEEPMPPYDHAAWAELARELDILIATGENEYTKYPYADLISRHGVDIVQPDNRRAGGVSEWMEIAAVAAAFGVDVASHGGGGANMHMLLAMPNAIYLESGSLKNQTSVVEPLRMRDGAILAPESPGMSSELQPGYIARYKVG
ncbi:MAG TPA: mandelate racemase/muconate lactonizing enzyme family protein [Bryobacteraceae bacterium]|nr:mandelate racemase/muconate lactonizing enzyme family protein [Bryobacteraceae bacterium]